MSLITMRKMSLRIPRGTGRQLERTAQKDSLRKFGQLVAERRVAKRIQQEWLAQKLDVHKSYISMIENARAAIPTDEVLDQLIAVLDLDVEIVNATLAQAELEGVRSTLKNVRPRFRKYLDELDTSSPKIKEPHRQGRFPKMGLAAAGKFMEAIAADRTPTGDVRFCEPWKEALEAAKSKRAFVVDVEGESMLPTISPGDEVLVDPKEGLLKFNQNPLHIALVLRRGEATIKRWKLVGKQTIVLVPDNPDRDRFHEIEIALSDFEDGDVIAYRVILARSTKRFV